MVPAWPGLVIQSLVTAMGRMADLLWRPEVVQFLPMEYQSLVQEMRPVVVILQAAVAM
jgi:hypothetical protein